MQRSGIICGPKSNHNVPFLLLVQRPGKLPAGSRIRFGAHDNFEEKTEAPVQCETTSLPSKGPCPSKKRYKMSIFWSRFVILKALHANIHNRKSGHSRKLIFQQTCILPSSLLSSHSSVPSLHSPASNSFPALQPSLAHPRAPVQMQQLGYWNVVGRDSLIAHTGDSFSGIAALGPSAFNQQLVHCSVAYKEVELDVLFKTCSWI
jgi:hypothetical protein